MSQITEIAQKRLAGVVVAAGRQMKTVTVQMVKQEWNRKLRKNYQVSYKILVNDPTSAVRAGDVVHVAPERHSKHVAHTVAAIIAPFGIPLEERPPLLTLEQRISIYQEKRARKAERRIERAALVKQGIVKEGDAVDDGNVTVVGIGKGKGKLVEDGRDVMKDGKHKFGKINDEAKRSRSKLQEMAQKGFASEKQRI